MFLEVGRPFGQRESLVHRIGDILQRYSKNMCIFRELIQNADDASATEIRFILDARPELGKEKTFGKKFNELQGPALCCWNNSIFRESDLEGLVKLGEGSKTDIIEKIGCFGVGFNSVYHLTDSPMFISDFADYIMFDPLCKYIEGINELQPGLRISDVDSCMVGVYDDVLSGFNFGVDLAGDLKTPLKGCTMFRFPLRTGFSQISKSVHSPDQIKELMKVFITEAKNNILFLKNIKTISFYVLANDENSKIKMSLMHKEEIKFEKTSDLRLREKFFTDIHKNMNSKLTDIKVESIEYCVTINDPKKIKAHEYLMLEQFGFEYDQKADKETLNYLETNKKTKCFPVAGIAFDLTNFKQKIYEKNKDFCFIYNFLPLEQKSPFCFHINGYWALHQENRTQLYDFAQTEQNVDRGTGVWNTKWNQSLINFIILPLYIKLMQFIIKRIGHNVNNENLEIFLQNWIKLFPQVLDEVSWDQLKPYFEKMYEKFYPNISEKKIIPINELNAKDPFNLNWYSAKDTLFSKSFIKFFAFNTELDVQLLMEILIKSGLKISSHNKLIDLFKEFGKIDLNQIQPSNLIQHLRDSKLITSDTDIKKTIFQNIFNLKSILAFCLSEDSELDQKVKMENCPLLVTNDGVLRRFTKLANSQPFLFMDCHIFENFQDKFVNLEIANLLRDKSSYFQKITIDYLAKLLPNALDEDHYNRSNKTTKFVEIKNQSDSMIIESIWKIIISFFNDLESKNPTTFNKRLIKTALKPIIKWALMPVNFGSENEKTYLAPFSETDNIICQPKQCLLNLTYLNLSEILCLDLKILPMINNFTQNIVNFLSKREDILNVLNQKKKQLKYLNSCDRSRILSFLNSSLIRINVENPFLEFDQTDKTRYSNAEVISMIKEFPIFEDVNNQVGSISNRTVFLFNNVVPQIPTDGLNDFSVKNNSVLINQSYSELFKYLGSQTINLNDFFKKFFEWIIISTHSDITPETYKPQIVYIKDNIGSFDDSVLNKLKNVRFVNKNGSYFSASDLYDSRNPLFQMVYEDSLLPDEYSKDNQWISFFVKIGLKTECSRQDCIKILRTLPAKYFANQIDFLKFCDGVKLLISEIGRLTKTGETTLLTQIKDIKFIPHYFNTICNSSIHTNIFNPSSQFNQLVCLNNSYFEENLNFVWITHSILPKFVLDSLKHKNNLKLVGIRETWDEATFVNNLTQLLAILEKSNFEILKSLNRKEIIDLLNSYFIKLEKFDLVKKPAILNQIKKLNLVLNQSYLNKTLQLFPANRFVKNLSKNDSIEPFILAIPSEFKPYWKLFKSLGANEELKLEIIQPVLLDLYHKYSNDKLNSTDYKHFLIAFKLLLSSDVLSDANLPQLNLFAPNLLQHMRNLSELYYIDDSCYESLIESSQELKSICLFDIKELKKLIENPNYIWSKIYGEESENKLAEENTNILYKIMLKKLNWSQIFESFPYFIKYPNLTPKPISKILIQKIIDNERNETKDVIENKKLNSESFLNSIVESIRLISDNPNLVDLGLMKFVQEELKTISVYNCDEIQSVYFNLKTGLEIENSHRSLYFARSKANNETKFLCNQKCTDKFEKYFYLSETLIEIISSSLRKCLVRKNFPEINQNIETLIADLNKQSHRFMFLVMKLLVS